MARAIQVSFLNGVMVLFINGKPHPTRAVTPDPPAPPPKDAPRLIRKEVTPRRP